MQVPVLLEPLPEKGYRVRTDGLFSLSAEGKTTTEALNKLQRLLEQRRDSGARVVYLEVAKIDQLPARGAGALAPDDPLAKEWEEAMAEYRRQCEDDPNY